MNSFSELEQPDPMVPGSILATPPADDPVVQEKARLRQQVRESRATRAANSPASASEVCAQLVNLVTDLQARSVAAFLSTPLEPPIYDFLAWARGNNVSVLLPLAREDGLLDWVIDRGKYVENPLLRVPEPVGDPEAPIAFDGVDLVICPAALVDETGGRLGWGGGYYDRMLDSTMNRPATYALVHDDEIVPEVPMAPHDMRVDGAVTPTRRLIFTRQP